MRFKHQWVMAITALAMTVFYAGPVKAVTPASNLEVMQRLADQVIEALLADMPDGAKRRGFVLIPYGNGEEYDLLTNQMSQLLTRRGVRIVAGPGAMAMVDSTGLRAAPGVGNEVELEYQAVDFSLLYPKVSRKLLVGGRRVDRAASLRLHARLVNPADNAVVWAGEKGESFGDRFSHKHLRQVEAGAFAFTKPEPVSGALGKIVEPVLVSGIVVGLVYLFFSNQNNN